MASFSKSALMASWSEVTKAFSLSEGIVLSFILSLPTEFFHQICRISSVEHALLLFCFDFTESNTDSSTDNY